MTQPKDKMVAPVEFPLGSMTLGGQFSEGLQSVFLDSLTPLWQPGHAVLFYNGRNSYNDSQQYVYSPGLVARYLVPGYDVILGVNAYYDFIDSQYGNQFGSFGFGAEILTHWVDARFNYYLPATDDIYLGTSRVTSTSRTVSGPVQNGNLIQTTTTTRTRTQQFNTYEAELEGWNGEIGFLIPGLDRYLETRVFGGYYQYDNPFGANYEGFKARLEAHLLPGLIAEVQWYNDAYLNGGHWIGGVRAQVPFDFFNLFHGRNPFEGAGQTFTPRQREFRERLSDMVIRSHRVKTVKSRPIRMSDRTVTKRQTTTIGIVPPPQPVSNGNDSAGGLEKTGAGTLDLGTGTSNFTGGTVSGGTLNLNNTVPWTTSGLVNVNNSNANNLGTLTIAPNQLSTGSVPTSGSAGVTLAGTTGINVNSGATMSSTGNGAFIPGGGTIYSGGGSPNLVFNGGSLFLNSGISGATLNSSQSLSGVSILSIVGGDTIKVGGSPPTLGLIGSTPPGF